MGLKGVNGEWIKPSDSYLPMIVAMEGPWLRINPILLMLLWLFSHESGCCDCWPFVKLIGFHLGEAVPQISLVNFKRWTIIQTRTQPIAATIIIHGLFLAMALEFVSFGYFLWPSIVGGMWRDWNNKRNSLLFPRIKVRAVSSCSTEIINGKSS